MADGFTIDTHELKAFAVTLDQAPAKAIRDVEATMEKAAYRIKAFMKDRFRARTHFRATANSVSYDRFGFTSIRYEIGPTIGDAGSLGGIAVEGGANGGGGTVKIDDLLEPELPALEKYLSEAMLKAMS